MSPRRAVKALKVAKTTAKYLICGCGGSKVKIQPVGHTKGDCLMCGEFGYYPRLYNARFDTERTGQNKRR